jgi:hypothetical protein
MNFTFNFIFIGFINIFILLSNKVYAENVTINILMGKPDALNEAKWNNYITYLDQNDILVNSKTGANNVKIHFSYDTKEPIPNNSKEKYVEVMKNMLKSIGSDSYDMFIFDEKFLYSDAPNIQSEFIRSTIESNLPQGNFVDLTSDISKEDLSHHSEDLLNKSYLNGHLYALPFELDFDLLYYPNNINLSKLDLETLSWEEIIDKNIGNGKSTLSVAFGEKDELLDLFIEYTETKYDNFYNNENDHFDLFYGEKSTELFNSFKEFIKKSSGKDIKEYLSTTYIDAYNSVFSKNEGAIFKGKASNYNSIAQLNNANQAVSILASLPPKNYDVTNVKFIVINKKSKIDKNLLIETAKTLTSREMQLQRSEMIGSIPTFNFKSNNEDYCKTNSSEICEFIKKIKPVDIKKVFDSRESTSFMEVRSTVPEVLLKFILDEYNVKYVTNVFSNIKFLILDKPENWGYLVFGTYLPFVLSFAFISTMMYYTYKFRNSPHIKYLSPGFCIIILVGLVMNSSIPFVHTFIKNNALAQFNYVYDTINTILFFLPMLFVTYRIYSIYNNTTNYNLGEKLNNKSLYTLFGIIFTIWTGYSILVCIFTDVYVEVGGDILDCRRTYYNFVFDNEERIIYRIYYILCIVLTCIMVARLGIVKKRYGEFKFAYMMIFALIFEHINAFVVFLLEDDSTLSFFGSNLLLTLVYTSFAYTLLGNKLIYLIRHPEEANTTRNKITCYDFSSDTFQYVGNSYTFKGSNNSKFNSDKSRTNKSQLSSFNGDTNSGINMSYNNPNSSATYKNSNSSMYNANNSIFNNLSNSIYNNQSNAIYNGQGISLMNKNYENPNVTTSMFGNRQNNLFNNNSEQKDSDFYRSQLINNLK